MWHPLAFLINLIRRERSRLRARLRPFAIAVVEDLFNRDFNQDGTVADARNELHLLLTDLRSEIKERIFDEYTWPQQGTVRTNVVAALPVRVLKKVLAMAMLARALQAKQWPVPMALVIKYGYGLLDSAIQEAYESEIRK